MWWKNSEDADVKNGVSSDSLVPARALDGLVVFNIILGLFECEKRLEMCGWMGIQTASRSNTIACLSCHFYSISIFSFVPKLREKKWAFQFFPLQVRFRSFPAEITVVALRSVARWWCCCLMSWSHSLIGLLLSIHTVASLLNPYYFSQKWESIQVRGFSKPVKLSHFASTA